MNITTAGIAFIDENTRYLLIRGVKAGKWGFPKGAIEIGESPIQAALREFKEETGVSLIINKNCEIISTNTYNNIEIFTVKGKYNTIEKNAYKNPLVDTNGEIDGINFFKINDIKSLATSFPIPSYFHINSNIKVIINDGIAFVNENNEVLYFFTKLQYYSLPYVKDINYPFNLRNMCITELGFDIPRHIIENSPTVIISNVRYNIIKIQKRFIEDKINITNESEYTNYEWIALTSYHADKEMKREIKLILGKLKSNT
jgi:8-oxo-dGTP pyrophosphatase MutT (NUDIX family)